MYQCNKYQRNNNENKFQVKFRFRFEFSEQKWRLCSGVFQEELRVVFHCHLIPVDAPSSTSTSPSSTRLAQGAASVVGWPVSLEAHCLRLRQCFWASLCVPVSIVCDFNEAKGIFSHWAGWLWRGGAK